MASDRDPEPWHRQTDRGFVQPADQAAIWAEHGAFALASRYDPWPLVIVEACAAGLPVIHSEACGSAVELVRPVRHRYADRACIQGIRDDGLGAPRAQRLGALRRARHAGHLVAL